MSLKSTFLCFKLIPYFPIIVSAAGKKLSGGAVWEILKGAISVLEWLPLPIREREALAQWPFRSVCFGRCCVLKWSIRIIIEALAKEISAKGLSTGWQQHKIMSFCFATFFNLSADKMVVRALVWPSGKIWIVGEAPSAPETSATDATSSFC